jgi:AcrR family transcriptional regulator
MLAAARLRFLEDSYETVTLRDIARDAGVDVALVSRYFGGKEELFRQVLRGTDGGDKFTRAAAAPSLAAYLAEMLTSQDADHDREGVERLLIILRSASSPKAAEVVRSALSEDVLEPMASFLSGPDAEMRASLSLGVLMGTSILRTIMSVDPLCECDVGQVRKRLERILAAALAETD